jgi:hypothetical protein
MIAASGRQLRDLVLTRLGNMPLIVGNTERLAALDLRPPAPNFDRLIPQLLAEAHL